MNNDFKVLTNETLKNVKNRPVQIDNKIAEWSRQIAETYNKKVDDCLMFCLLELGFQGKREKEEVAQFIESNNIEITHEISRRLYCEKYTIECKSKKYKKEIILEL